MALKIGSIENDRRVGLMYIAHNSKADVYCLAIGPVRPGSQPELQARSPILTTRSNPCKDHVERH